jgi:hypothetical protein
VDIPGASVDAPWEVTWQPLTYWPKPDLIDEQEIRPVYAGQNLKITVKSYEGNTSTDLIFKSNVGKPKPGALRSRGMDL